MQYETIQEETNNKSFENSPLKTLTIIQRLRSPALSKALLLQNEINMPDRPSNPEPLPVSGTIHSSYNLINESRKYNDKYSGLK